MASRTPLFLIACFCIPPASFLACGDAFTANGAEGGASASTGSTGSPAGSSTATSSSGSSSHSSSVTTGSSSGGSGDAGACQTSCVVMHPIGYADFEKYAAAACGCASGAPCAMACAASCMMSTMEPDALCSMCVGPLETQMPPAMCIMEAEVQCNTNPDCKSFLECAQACVGATPQN